MGSISLSAETGRPTLVLPVFRTLATPGCNGCGAALSGAQQKPVRHQGPVISA
jgi:hypothetical protein